MTNDLQAAASDLYDASARTRSMLAALSSILVAATCSAPLPQGIAVQAPIVFKTGCGGFRLETNGELTRLPYGWFADHEQPNPRRRFGAGLKIERNRAGRLTLRRGGETVWRSHHTYPNTAGDNAFGPRTFAFASYYRGVFLSDLRGPERVVLEGQALYPLDFFDSGRLIVTGKGELTILSPRGRVEGRHAYDREAGVAFDTAANTLYFVTPGRRLAALHEQRLHVGRRIFFRGMMWLATPRRLLFSAGRGLTLADLDGRVSAQASWGEAVMDAATTVSPDGRHVGFRLSDPKRRRAAVWIVSAGQSRARPVYRHSIAYVGCGDGAAMTWHDGLALYNATDGHVAVIDTGGRRPVDLTRVVSALPRKAGEQPLVAWASLYANA